MTEFGVRQQDSVGEDCTPDPGAQGDDHDTAGVALARTELHLGQPSRVGIVQDRHFAAERVTEECSRIHADPGRIDVRGGLDHAGANHGRHRDADRSGAFKLAHHLGDRVTDKFGGGGRRRERPDSLAGQFATRHVDRSALDASAADVDADRRG